MTCHCSLPSCSICTNSFKKVSFNDRMSRLSQRMRLSLENLIEQQAYTVSLVWTVWSGEERGIGQESLLVRIRLSPDPALSDLTSVSHQLFPVGALEVGSVQISRINPLLSGSFLLGKEVLREALVDTTCPNFYFSNTFVQYNASVYELQKKITVDNFLKEIPRDVYKIPKNTSFYYEVLEKNSSTAKPYKFRPSGIPFRSIARREWRLNLEKVYEDNRKDLKSNIDVDYL